MDFHPKKVIFYSYVGLPEGIQCWSNLRYVAHNTSIGEFRSPWPILISNTSTSISPLVNKHTQGTGKSCVLIGKSSINGSVCWRVAVDILPSWQEFACYDTAITWSTRILDSRHPTRKPICNPRPQLCLLMYTPISITGWWFQSLWKILVNWDDYSQYMGKWKMFQTTNQNNIWYTRGLGIPPDGIPPDHQLASGND